MKVIEVLSCLTLLAAITSAVEIECKYQIAYWGNIGNLYACSATVVNAENPATVTDITGTHLAGKGNEDVKAFTTTGIALFWNKLVTLDGDLFQHTRKLREINVGGNLLQHVGHDLFTGLTDLTFASFSNNPCINKIADTPEQIQELNIQLPIQCPPLAATPDPSTTTKTPDSTTEWIEPETSPITTRSTAVPPTTPKSLKDVTISFVCPGDGFGSIPNANFCSRYFECNRGIRSAKKCPAGQIFDVITSKCGDPDTSLCALNIRCV